MNCMSRYWVLPLLAVSILALPATSVEWKFTTSNEGFETFIPPLSNPVYFEDPMIATELRPFIFYQDVSDDWITSGGDFQVYAMQARLALTERLAFIATKDGYADTSFDSVLRDDDGFADLAAGFKYNFIRDEELQLLVTAGLTVEWNMGDSEVYQGRGLTLFFDEATSAALGTRELGLGEDNDFDIQPFISAGWGCNGWHYLGNLGFIIPENSDAGSTFVHMSAHVDYMLTESFYPVLEMHWYHVLDAGNRLPATLAGLDLGFEGNDLFNFGASAADGNNFVSIAPGFRYRFTDLISAGAAFEIPISGREDMMDWRLMVDMAIRF